LIVIFLISFVTKQAKLTKPFFWSGEARQPAASRAATRLWSRYVIIFRVLHCFEGFVIKPH
jgi:hypothetical protein